MVEKNKTHIKTLHTDNLNLAVMQHESAKENAH